MAQPKPWEQQDGESPVAFRAFCTYMNLLPTKRSLAHAAEVLGRSVHSVEALSKKYKWSIRLTAWEAHLNQRIADAQVDAVAKMRERHIQIGVGFQTAVVKELKALVNKIERAAEDARDRAIKEGRDPEKAHHEPVLTPAELVKLSQHGVELERLTRGLATMHASVNAAPDSFDEARGKLTLEELKILRELQSKLSA